MISWLEKNNKISWAITISIFILTFYLSSLRLPPPTIGPPNVLAIAYHISIFFLLAAFFFISILRRRWEFKKIILSIILVAIYAVLDELHQFFVPGRVASMNDFLLDFTGIIFASLIYFIFILRKRY